MIVANRGSVIGLLRWQSRGIAFSLSMATLVTIAYMVFDQTWLVLPSLPLAVVGAALGIFVSFRTNSAYDRWWEGRKLWGRLVNTSRHVAVQANNYLPAEHRATADRIVRRQIAYVHALRVLLRLQDPFEDEVLLSYLTDEEKDELRGSSNLTARLLDNNMAEFQALNRQGVIDDRRLQTLDESIRHLFDIQGGSERIKKTPLPRPYSFMSETMIQWFAAVMPCGLVAALGWGAIPISGFVLFGFKLISETGRILEDPFNMFYNGLPLGALSNTIERNLLEIIGTPIAELPEPTKEDPPGILM